MNEGAIDLIKTCPHCGFEPLNGKLVCPRCGKEIEENIAHKLQDIDEKNRENNDSIAWNDFQNVSLGALMNHLENNSDEVEANLEEDTKAELTNDKEMTETPELEETSKPEEPSESVDELEDNPILSAYIKRHREGKEEGPSLEELVAAQQETAPTTDLETVDGDAVESEALEEDVAEPAVDIEETEVKAEPVTTEVLDETEELVEEELPTVEPSENEVSIPAAEPVADEAESEKLAPVEDLESTPEEVEKTITSESEKAPEQPAPTALPEKEILEEVIPVDAVEDIEPDESDESDLELVSAAAATKAFEPESEEVVTKAKSNRKKWPVVLAAAVLLAGGGSAYAYHQHQEAQAEKQAQAELKAEVKSLQATVDDLYLNEDKEYLKAGITTEEVEKAMKQVADLAANEKTKSLKAELNDIEEKLDLQNQVNALFAKPVISGDQLAKDVPLASQEAITLKVSGPDAFDQLLAQGVQNANEQLDQLNNAQAAVSSLVKDGKAVANPKEADYKAAQKLVTSLVTSDEKTELTNQLKLVETKINENKAAEKAAQEKEAAEKAEAEKAAQEKAAQDAAAQQNSTASGGNLPAEASPNMQTNAANQPILASDAADIADTNNAAWTWNSGVLDKVIATCIQRGYIVEGGYKLEPVRIENGEGYYNLYATTNKAPLTANYKDSDLPLYLVTINCKTGYFRGNGNDHTIR